MSTLLSPSYPPAPKAPKIFETDDDDDDDEHFETMEPETIRILRANPKRVLNLTNFAQGYGAEAFFPHPGVSIYMHSVEAMNAVTETVENSVGPRILMGVERQDPAKDQKIITVKTLADFLNLHFIAEKLDHKFEDIVAIAVSRFEAADYADAEKNYRESGVDPEKHWSHPFFEWLKTKVVLAIENGKWSVLKMSVPAIKTALDLIHQANAGLPPATGSSPLKRAASEAPPPSASSSSSSAAASAPVPPPPPSIPPSEPAAKRAKKPAAAAAPAPSPQEPLITRAIKALQAHHAEAGQASLDAFYAYATVPVCLPRAILDQAQRILHLFTDEQSQRYYNTPIQVPDGVLGGGHMIAGFKSVLGPTFASVPPAIQKLIHSDFVVPPELAAISATETPNLRTLATIYTAVAHLPIKYAQDLM